MESSGFEAFFSGMLKMLGGGLKGPQEEELKVLVTFVGSWGGFKMALGRWEGGLVGPGGFWGARGIFLGSP